jgi:hypothetical protein
VRGASLRELKQFFERYDKDGNYAGLRRIGDPNDGTAIWTRVAEDDVEAKIAERARQRLQEKIVGLEATIERDRTPDQPDIADAPTVADDEPTSPVTPTSDAASRNQKFAKVEDALATESSPDVSQKQMTEKLEAVNEKLGKVDTLLEDVSGKVEKMEDRLTKKIDAAGCNCVIA